MNDCIAKPVDPEKVIAVLDEWLPNQNVDAEPVQDDDANRIETLKRHLNAEDVSGIAEEGHSIKGASSITGGEALSVVASRIEQAGKAGKLEGAF